MSRNDVDLPSLHAGVLEMPQTFYTKDVSGLASIRGANASLLERRNYHAFIGGALSDNRGSFGIELISTGHPRGALWRRLNISGARIGAAPPIEHPIEIQIHRVASPTTNELTPVTTEQVVRRGHFETVRYMRTDAFKQIKDLFDAVPEFGGVYFRPLDSGVRVVDLDPTSPKPRIGVGRDSLIPRGSRIEHIQPSIAARIEYLRAVRARQKSPSLENQFEARVIRGSLLDGLRMPSFGPDLRFIHSQWRIDRPDGIAGQAFTDLIAADIRTKALVIIELKAFPDAAAAVQVAQYAKYFHLRNAELLPLFDEIARTMGELYGCTELADFSFAPGRVDTYIAWPTLTGEIATTKTSTEHAHGVEEPSEVSTSAITSHRSGMEIGPQHAGHEPAFRRRMRLHQSWYRANVLRVPCGIGPGPGSETFYGNMLPADAAEAGANFLSPEIFGVVRERIAERTGAVDEFRLLRNMLSSQPLCFNLFAPLKRDLGLATTLLQSTFGADRIGRVTDVKIEYAPQPASDYLGDRTAFDVFIEYRTPQGEAAFLGVEVKLTESFSAKRYDGARYREFTNRPGSPWRPEAAERLPDVRWNQLWRNHLLVEALRTHHTPMHGRHGALVLLRHPLDSDCVAAAEAYAALLHAPEDMIDLSLETLIASWESATVDRVTAQWLSELRRRYLDLRESEHGSYNRSR